MKSCSSREIITLIEADGWNHVRTEGSHHHYKHPTKTGIVTVPHSKKDVPLKTTKSIFKQAGIT